MPPEPFGLTGSLIAAGLFVGPVWLLELKVRIRKEGSKKMVEHSMIVAGIDTGKLELHVCLLPGERRFTVNERCRGHRRPGRGLPCGGGCPLRHRIDLDLSPQGGQGSAPGGFCGDRAAAAPDQGLCPGGAAMVEERSARCQGDRPLRPDRRDGAGRPGGRNRSLERTLDLHRAARSPHRLAQDVARTLRGSAYRQGHRGRHQAPQGQARPRTEEARNPAEED